MLPTSRCHLDAFAGLLDSVDFYCCVLGGQSPGPPAALALSLRHKASAALRSLSWLVPASKVLAVARAKKFFVLLLVRERARGWSLLLLCDPSYHMIRRRPWE